jgi:Protein of unknown function (DUF3052)
MSGYSGTPLPQKLGIRPHTRLYLEGAPDDYRRLVSPLPAGVQFVPRLDAATDLVHLFATRRAPLARALTAARRTMRADAVIWVSWPKKSAALESEVSEDVIRELALPLGLVDIKVCAVDDTWSGLKLMLRRSERAEAAAKRPPARRSAK